MPPADVSPAATDRPEPSGPGGREGTGTRDGATVPPPCSAPEASTPPPGDADPEATAEGGPAAGTDGLTERERRVLAFERQWWRHAGAKEQAIRDTFGLSATRYYQLLNALLDNPAALAADPVLVARLRRLRASRARNRRR